MGRWRGYAEAVSYTTADARTQMLADIARAADGLAGALASLTEAYEALDDDGADALEGRVFRPVQTAYGRLRRTYADFAARHGFPERRFAPGSSGTHNADPRVHLERALQAAEEAEQSLADLQDSMLPVEVGDPELRAGLSETRALLAAVPAESARLLRTIGR